MACATGHSTLPFHQLRPSLSNPPSSISSDIINFSSFSQINKSATTSNFPREFFRLRNSKKSKSYCLCSKSNEISAIDNGFSDGVSSSAATDWDWNRWTRYFSEIEQAESYASLLKFQLEDAIEREDFEEAAKLKSAIVEATSKDAIAEIMSKLKDAIEQERYHDASRLCQNTGSGLVGWWVGYSKDSEDPFGRIVRITPGVGRFVGRCYSPRQLAAASPGTPLFEIFVVKDAEYGYSIQVVFLQRMKGNTAKSTKTFSTAEIENASVIDIGVSGGKESEKSEEKALEEKMKNVMNFLLEKIPELKIHVQKRTRSEELSKELKDDTDSVNELINEDNDSSVSPENDKSEAAAAAEEEEEEEEEESDLDDFPSATEGEKDLETKLFIGGVVHNKEEDLTKDEYIRVPAEIEDIAKDTFVLHIPKREKDKDAEESIAAKIKLAAVASQGVSELMPLDVAKAFWNSDKVSPKVARDVREIVKFAVNQAQKRNKFSEFTNFSRITPPNGDFDPFDGLYVGAFGPHGAEVVQLRRKYGNWNTSNDDVSSDVEFFEYVEAVKLTGDLNVPAGQVTFRARIGKGSRLSNRGAYPDELGVVASYHGQGRIAEFGYRNPKWVKGELLQLNGKGMSPVINGADLGFLFMVPEQSFLVLFNRLKLPE